MVQREKLIDINKLDKASADALSLQLGVATRNMVDEAADKINNLLKIYGMSAKLQVVISGNELPAQVPAPKAAPKKRGRPRKQS